MRRARSRTRCPARVPISSDDDGDDEDLMPLSQRLKCGPQRTSDEEAVVSATGSRGEAADLAREEVSSASGLRRERSPQAPGVGAGSTAGGGATRAAFLKRKRWVPTDQ